MDFPCALDGSREPVKWQVKSAGKAPASVWGATTFPIYTSSKST